MALLKSAAALICFLVLASNVWSMSHWTESRGVYDDICYLRQAHLFQRFGLGGLDTDISRDDDSYLASKLKAIGYGGWNDPAVAPCHTSVSATSKRVLQYPPGTGLALAMFPPGFQVIPLYVSASVIVFAFVLLALFYARAGSLVLLAGAFGCLAIYLMINPAKASYSVAPTMAACALGGFLTAFSFAAGRRRSRFALWALTGLVIGLSVNFRLPNLLLASGYLLFFGSSFLFARKPAALLQGALFGLAFLLGMVPMLAANAINAGSPFSTTYGAADAMPPAFSLGLIREYAADVQFVLLLLAGAWTIAMWRSAGKKGTRKSVAGVCAGNLAVNLAFFLSHPVFTPYYTIPVAMLCLWSLLFASVMEPPEAVDGRLIGRAAGV